MFFVDFFQAYGQDKDFIIEITSNDDITIYYNGYNILIGSEYSEIDDTIAFNLVRTKLISLIGHLTNSFSEDHLVKIINFCQEFKDIFADKSNKISSILRDLISDNPNEGQISKAVSNELWYKKWGKHYLLSIQRAHECMICNNFKDPGVQIYGGEMFQNLRDIMEDTFCNMPAPTPSIKLYRNSSSSSSYIPTNMNSYMNSGGVCFDGDSVVIMENGGIQLVKSIKKGDILFNGYKVRCVIKTKVNGLIDMCQINNMLITPWHPLCMNDDNNWVFPINIVQPIKIDIDFVYNFVLEEGHYCIINGLKVVTLGHDFDNNDVIQHSYYGSNHVIQDLMKFQGWNEGLVLLDKPRFERDNQGRISNISA